MAKQKTGYHWLIVGAAFLMMAVTVGILVNCFAALGPALNRQFTEGGSVQLVFTIAVLANLVGGALAGRIYAKISMQKLMPVFAIILSAGVFSWSQFWTSEPSLTMMYVSSVFVGIGASFLSIVPMSIVINNWFQERKGLAMAIYSAGSVVAGLVLVPVVNSIVAEGSTFSLGFGPDATWQQAYMLLGIIAAVVSIPTALFIIRSAPKEKGLLPYGATEESSASSGVEATGISLGKYIKTPSFILLALSCFLIGFVNLGIQNHIVFYLEGAAKFGQAAVVFSIGMGVMILGKVLLGFIYDKKGILVGQIYCLACGLITIALMILSGITQNAIFAFAFGAAFGLVGAMTTVTPPYVTARIVGIKHYPTIFGILSLTYGLGVAVGPMVIEGVMSDDKGVYNSDPKAWIPILIVLAAIAVIMAVTTVFSYIKGIGFDSETD